MSDLRKRRGEILADIAGQVAWYDLPGPMMTCAYRNGILALTFDSAEDLDAWVAHLGMRHGPGTTAHGEFRGWRIQGDWVAVAS